MTFQPEALRLTADVLVAGGGPAGAWAALAARRAGAERVVLVDKGYCGTSGATASANTGVWHVPPERRAEVAQTRAAQSDGLARAELIETVLDTTAQQLAALESAGFPFPRTDDGRTYRDNLRGPDYMAFLRKLVVRAGVRVLDHSPLLELLTAEGRVVGGRGARLFEEHTYEVRAGAVILACGGVAFLSKTLGCDVNTGDGLLMAAEVGAALSGMEFSAQYGICPAYSSVTKGLPYFWATFSDEAGNVLSEGENRMMVVANGLRRGPVYAVLDRAGPDVQRWLREGQPNCFLPHDRAGVDPFRERFRVALRCEGTVRGTGGIRILDRTGRSEVPGLYAAGDAASREWLVGARTGGGAPNAAWAISSGSWAGEAAAVHARSHGVSDVAACAAGDAGLRPSAGARAVDLRALNDTVRSELLPLDKNLFRSEAQLHRSLRALDAAYDEARAHLSASPGEEARARQAVALLASARFAYRSALARTESRGLHRRVDHPSVDPAQGESLLVRGVDRVSVERAGRHPNLDRGAS
jgi:succinate dehydrogenase/fumarate reductase flavoprotein subunit